MQFIDLAAQQRRIRNQIEENIRAVLDHGKYIMGPEIAELEQRLGEYAGVKNVICCASGTDALLMGLMAYGVKPGDAVFTTPFTFIATAEVIRLLGATPVFADIDPNTCNIDPGALEAEIIGLETRHPNLTPRGIIPVDLFGLPADYGEINRMAKAHGLFVMEDAAQSFGAEYHGQKACGLGDCACTSFFPAKPLGCYGDGGAIFTDNGNLAQWLQSIRIHGQGKNKYDNIRIGLNGRMDTLQAAILLAKLSIFPEEVDLRQAVALRYTAALEGSGLIPPTVPPKLKSVWAQYSVLAEDGDHRNRLQARLKDAGIPTAIYYPKPLHLQEAFSGLKYEKGSFPVSEACAARIFSLPMHPYLDQTDQDRIIDVLISNP